jgi:hypothetical protein
VEVACISASVRHVVACYVFVDPGLLDTDHMVVEDSIIVKECNHDIVAESHIILKQLEAVSFWWCGIGVFRAFPPEHAGDGFSWHGEISSSRNRSPLIDGSWGWLLLLRRLLKSARFQLMEVQ